jgi:rhamnosyl/mannosyltransferase
MARILIVGKYYHPFEGGIEANTLSIAELLAKSHQVTALVNAHSPEVRSERINGVDVIRKKRDLHIKSQPVSFGFFGGVRLQDYDVIHFHAPNPYASVLLSLKMALSGARTPLVITHHMDIFGRKALRALTMGFYLRLARQARAVIVTSKKNAAVSADLPKGLEPAVIPLGIAPANYPITDDLRREGKAWLQGLVGDAPAIGFLGRHARYKGLDVLLNALLQLPGAHAVIAGDGPYRASAEALAKELGLEARAHFLGKIDDRTKLKMLTAIDVFAFPSTEITEAFGVSQMEAMICGAPVVASNLPTGVTDVAIDGETALLAEPGSADSLAAQIRRLLDDRPLAEALGARGRNHILTNMSEAVVAERTRHVIEAALAPC